MNTKIIVSTGMAVLTCAGFSLLAEDSRNDQPARNWGPSHPFVQGSPIGVPAKASQILGREIRDASDRKIGKVRDLAVDLQNGRVVEVIVATGGFLGIKETDTAVPPGEFSWDPYAKKLVCQLGQEQLRNAPPFVASHWSEYVTPERVREIYHRYNVPPYFVDESLKTPPTTEAKPASQLTSAGMATPTAHLGRVERIRDIIGAPVQNPQDEHLGKVQNVIVDLTASRIVVLIVSTGGFLDMGDEVSAIPAQAFQRDANQNRLSLNATRETLQSAPHFKPGEWPGVANSDRIALVYNAYNIPPYSNATDVDNTAENIRDRSGDTLTPFNQGRSAADRAITARIRREIMAHPDLSIDARNVKIITIDGQVTLRGPVRTREEEETIIRIARNAVAQDTRVTNQIETISQPVKVNGSSSPADSN